MTLTKSIYSHTTGRLYAAKYEPVMLISHHGNVLIVEGANGRFPVHCDYVTDEVAPAEPDPEPEKIRLRGEKRTHKNPPQKSQKNIIQNTLFE